MLTPQQKVKVLSRPAASQQTPGSNVARQHRNLDPAQHPFERAREYTRALNATKLERMFAAPFVAQLGKGHVDGVYTMAKDPGSLEHFASGSGDGVVKVWNMASREEIWATHAHENIVKGMCWTPDQKLISCASDKTIKVFDPYNSSSRDPPMATYLGQTAFTSVSHQYTTSHVRRQHQHKLFCGPPRLTLSTPWPSIKRKLQY
jgi:WD repeat and SOF domain-containing protein 1